MLELVIAQCIGAANRVQMLYQWELLEDVAVAYNFQKLVSKRP